ncbi:methyltransferase dimerization domain-containing protein [Leifsonia sp. NPDC102414]|uniref:methyltransferase n=1 Tax=Leifsonia sp. NPDC102414 TaxID=3364124 RepID=UPI0038205B60
MTSTRAATPEAIVDIAIGFMGAKQLFAASRVGLFTALADGPLDVAGLAAATTVSEQQIRVLADSMTAQGLLTRTDGRYELTQDAAAYLTGDRADIDLAPFLAFLNATSYPQWLGYDSTVDTNDAGVLDLDDAGWGAFLDGVMTYNELHAAMLVRHFDFAPYRNALDLGGLSPAFAAQAMRANPDLRMRFVFDQQSVPSVQAAVDAAGLADRSVVEGAETATAEPGGEHDLVLVNHVIHRFSDAENRAILQHARAAAAPGATLVVLDFFLDDDQEQRKIDALHAGEYYNIDGTVVYQESVVREWLAAAGWTPRGTIALPGSPRILVADAA